MCVMCVCAVWDPCTEHSCISLSFDITYALHSTYESIEDRGSRLLAPSISSQFCHSEWHPQDTEY